MGINTRSRKRETVCSSCVEFSVDVSAQKSFKLNIPKDSMGPGARKAIAAILLDISVIGCSLDSSYMIPSGVLLHIKIDPAPFRDELGKERKEPLRFTGEVKSCVMKAAGHYRVGVEFKKSEKEDIDLISGFIASKERRRAARWNMGTK